MYITTKEVFKTIEGLINPGRAARGEGQIEITGLNSPAMLLNTMTSDDLAALDVLNLYKGISANSYSVKASLLWTSLFWKIGEQILIVANYNSPFQKYYKDLQVGGDIEEIAPRIKEGIDRQTLSNSALFTNYVTQWDSFYHRVNQFKVWASTYDQYEIQRISNTWDNVTNHLNAEMQNILLSTSDYIQRLSKDALASQYLLGGMDEIVLPAITDQTSAQQAAILMNNAIDDMTIEINSKYIPFNRNANNPDPTIRDITTSPLVLVVRADLMNSIHFMTALETYFGKEWQNDKFAGNVLKVTEWPTTDSADIQVTPGYTTPEVPGEILGFILEENAFIYRQKMIGTFNFDNAATLKTSIFNHLEAMANISDRRKSVALVRK